MKRRLNTAITLLRDGIGSRYFFWFFIGLFVLSSLWVATASLYPMAFDEDFHLGLIKIYATSWLPYGINHTSDMATYGLATADPSYLFHYLLSFPYRLMNALGMSESSIVITLRLINVALLTTALFVYRRGLLAAGASRPVTHVALALFTLIPILPVMAGQINYDNPLLLIVALSFYLTVLITNVLRANGRLPALLTWALLITMLYGVAVKYAYLPVALSFVVWLSAIVFIERRKIPLRKQWRHFWQTTGKLKLKTKAIIAVILLVGLFFSAKYVVNLAEYHHPIPQCDQVFTDAECQAYGPWQRNTMLKQMRSDSFQPVSFPEYVHRYWLPGMSERLTFAVAGPTNLFQTKHSFKFTKESFELFFIAGSLCLALTFLTVFRRWPFVILTLLVTMAYVGPLVWRLYKSYITTAEPVAINGRYLLPLLPMIAASMLLAMSVLLRKLKLSFVAPVAVIIYLLALIVNGGGLGTYVLQAEPHWLYDGWGKGTHNALKDTYQLFLLTEESDPLKN